MEAGVKRSFRDISRYIFNKFLNMKQIATAVATLATSTFAYDDSIKECWDVRLRDESFFCYGEVGWPLSKNVYYDQVKRDDGKFFLKV